MAHIISEIREEATENFVFFPSFFWNFYQHTTKQVWALYYNMRANSEVVESSKALVPSLFNSSLQYIDQRLINKGSSDKPEQTAK